MSIVTPSHRLASAAMPAWPQAVPVPRISHPQQQTRTAPSTVSSVAYTTFASGRRYFPSFCIPDTRIDPAQAIESTGLLR
jgi:hypothetical protein